MRGFARSRIWFLKTTTTFPGGTACSSVGRFCWPGLRLPKSRSRAHGFRIQIAGLSYSTCNLFVSRLIRSRKETEDRLAPSDHLC